MDQKKKDDLKSQIQFKLFDDPPGTYLDDLEDIFAPEDNEEKPTAVEPIYWNRCPDCGEVFSICNKCHTPFDEGYNVHCIVTVGKKAEHYCDECRKMYKILEKGKDCLKKPKAGDPEKKSVVVKQIGWAECFGCKQVVSVCSKCHIEFAEGDSVYCVDTGEGYAVHYCEKCSEK